MGKKEHGRSLAPHNPMGATLRYGAEAFLAEQHQTSFGLLQPATAWRPSIQVHKRAATRW